METEYKTCIVHGHEHVVAFSDRKQYSYTAKENDKDGNIISVRKIDIAKPNYLGIDGMCLCGVLKKGETLEQWIKAEIIRKKRIANE